MFSQLTPYQGNKTRIRYQQSVGDIMSGILVTHNTYASEYDKICEVFNKRSVEATCRSIYNYLLDHTIYKVEPNDKQTLRSPSAILSMGADPNIGLDCKSYSLFIAGVLDALNRSGRRINWCYRFASYNILDKMPHHVFIVVNPGTDNEIFVDPVIKPFNYKKTYFYKIDKKPKNMALYSISGIGKTKKTKAEKQQAKAKAKAKIKQDIKKAGKVVLKYAPVTVAGRNAFLLLVKLNAFKLAEKLALAYQKNPEKVKAFWTKFGGNFESLKKNINIGGKKHGANIGTDPVVTPTLIASATPILVAIAKLLKEMGISADDLKKFTEGVIEDAIDKKAEKQAEKEPTIADQESAPAESIVPEEETTGTDVKKYLPVLAVVGVGAYFLLKKR